MKVMESVTEDFLKLTYNKLNEIDGRKMCVDPWPPSKSAPTDGSKLVWHFGLYNDIRFLVSKIFGIYFYFSI